MMRSRRWFFYEADGGGAGGTPAPDPAPDGADVQQQDQAPAWFSQLSRETREKYPDLARYKTLNDLAEYASRPDQQAEPDYTGYLKMPTKDSTTDELREFLTKLGVPEGPDKYSIPEDQDSYRQALQKTLREQAYRAGLSDQQAKSMWGVMMAMHDNAIGQYQKELKDKVDNFDSRYEGLFREQYAQKPQRDAAVKESLGYFQTFLQESGLGTALKESGAIYDERIVKGIAEYQKKVRGKFSSGSSGKGGSEGGGTKLNYSNDFYEAFGRK